MADESSPPRVPLWNAPTSRLGIGRGSAGPSRRFLGAGLVAIVALGSLAIWHLVRRGRLIRERLGAPRDVRLPELDGRILIGCRMSEQTRRRSREGEAPAEPGVRQRFAVATARHAQLDARLGGSLALPTPLHTESLPVMDHRFRPHERIKHPADFRRAFDRKRSASDAHLIVYGVENGLPTTRGSGSRRRRRGSGRLTSGTGSSGCSARRSGSSKAELPPGARPGDRPPRPRARRSPRPAPRCPSWRGPSRGGSAWRRAHRRRSP